MERKILLLGDPRLYEMSEPVPAQDIPALGGVIADLHDTLMAFRKKYNCGRAIAAPQIGVKKRVLYMNIDRAYVFINPSLEFPDGEMFEVMDDCMSFPGLLVKVMRHKHCTIRYTDENGCPQAMELMGDLSELLQHEYDHLDGILAVQRAIDDRSFFIKEVDG